MFSKRRKHVHGAHISQPNQVSIYFTNNLANIQHALCNSSTNTEVMCFLNEENMSMERMFHNQIITHTTDIADTSQSDVQ